MAEFWTLYYQLSIVWTPWLVSVLVLTPYDHSSQVLSGPQQSPDFYSNRATLGYNVEISIMEMQLKNSVMLSCQCGIKSLSNVQHPVESVPREIKAALETKVDPFPK